MAKKRLIDPEIWTDGKFVSLEPLARLLFIGMWNFACDNGHLDDDALQLKMRVLPADNCDVPELLETILGSGMVERANGYLKVVNLAARQSIDLRYLVLCDECPNDPHSRWSEADRKPRDRVHAGGTRAARETPKGAPRNGGGGVDGGGDGEGGASAPRRSPERPLPEDWQPTPAHTAYATEHRIDLIREAFKFRNHAAANDRRQRNWNAAFTTWLAKAVEFRATQPKPKADRSHLPEAWR